MGQFHVNNFINFTLLQQNIMINIRNNDIKFAIEYREQDYFNDIG